MSGSLPSTFIAARLVTAAAACRPGEAASVHTVHIIMDMVGEAHGLLPDFAGNPMRQLRLQRFVSAIAAPRACDAV